MIYCLNCGKGIPDQSKFCTFCGSAIKPADPVQTEATPTPTPTPTPQPPEYSNPVPPEQQYVPHTPPPTPTPTPPPTQPYVPPQQQYTPPPQQQYVPPQQQYTPPPVHQYVNPNHPTQHYAQQQPVATKNEYYKNVGFWGAVLMLIGFFLPYNNINEGSFYYLVTEGGSAIPSLYLYLIFPISGAILIIQGLTGSLPKALVAIFKILPLLFLIFIGVGISQSESSFASVFGNDIETILQNIGIGFYMIVIGTILILFFKTTKRKV